jgi:hypothetical protein
LFSQIPLPYPKGMESQPPPRFRKLRLAAAVGWGFFAVFLIVIWVRSSRWSDQLKCPCGSERSFYVVSCRGKVGIVTLPDGYDQKLDPLGNRIFPNGLTSGHLSPTGTVMEPNGNVTLVLHTNFNRAGEMWGWERKPLVLASYWMIAPPAVLLCCWGVAPFLHQRFSLRTLLIATAIVAAILGLSVWAAAP